MVGDRGKSGYVSFVDPLSKTRALNSSVGEENEFSIEDYDVTHPTNPKEARAFRPFKYVLIASYRPSIVSENRLISYLSNFGPNFGKMFVPCPYDKDRMFLYFGYNRNADLEAATLKHSISIEEVCNNQTFGSDRLHDDVFVYPFKGHSKFSYGADIDVVISIPTNFQMINDYFGEHYGDINHLRPNLFHRKSSMVTLSFRDKYAVYRMFYRKTRFGRITLPLPTIQSSAEEVMDVTIPWTNPHLHPKLQAERVKYWNRHVIKLHNVRDAPETEHDLMEFSNDFLDDMQCNPGIVTGRWFREGSISLTFVNEWHSAHVAHRLLQLQREGMHDYDVEVDYEWYNRLRDHFND